MPSTTRDIIDMAGTFAVINDPQTAKKFALDTAHWYCLGRSRSAFERCVCLGSNVMDNILKCTVTNKA